MKFKIGDLVEHENTQYEIADAFVAKGEEMVLLYLCSRPATEAELLTGIYWVTKNIKEENLKYTEVK